MRFTAYVFQEGGVVEFEVLSKIRTNVRGHYTYMLQGLTDLGNKANALVNQSQWERFDVPVEERAVGRKTDRRRMRNRRMQPAVGRGTPVPKSQRKAYNEEIERWLAEHYDIDLDELKENELNARAEEEAEDGLGQEEA